MAERGRDITGVRSGKVVAIERSSLIRRGSVLWECRCDCGKVFYTEGYKIAKGRVRSCGCARYAKKKELTGQRFGHLTALERLEEKKGKDTSYLWLCRCDCGKEIKASVNRLTSGRSTSCGCEKSKRMQARAKDIAGKTFGRLTALEATNKRKGESVVWRCACACGRETEVSYNSLVTGNTQSCGCLQREKRGPQEYLHYVEGTCVELLETKKLRSNNTSGYTGVQYHKRSGKWQAVITFRGKVHYLGKYKEKAEAIRARQQAEEALFGSLKSALVAACDVAR